VGASPITNSKKKARALKKVDKVEKRQKRTSEVSQKAKGGRLCDDEKRKRTERQKKEKFTLNKGKKK